MSKTPVEIFTKQEKLNEAFFVCASVVSFAVLVVGSHFFGETAGGIGLFASAGVFALVYFVRFVLFPPKL
jgi:hypothetical protein